MSELSAAGSGAASVVERVREMYARYPYPPLGSETGVALFALLDLARHVLWPERRSLQGLRVLDAGCGTGHTSVQLALNHPEVEVMGVDVSAPSLELAERRAREAGLALGERLSFRQAKIESLTIESLTMPGPTAAAARGGRPFDYIIASGVLHHMADPVEGARRLAALLAPNGGMAVMLYAPHGRAGVYIVQEALRRLVGDLDLGKQVEVARQLVANLPPNHPFHPKQFADQDWQGDAGLVDLLLHVQDRSYSVPQVFDLVDQTGLRLERFLSPPSYRPENYVAQPALRDRLSALDLRAGAAMAELLSGAMSQHAFFATRADYRPARATVNSSTLMAMRPVRSPLFRWEDLGWTEGRGPRAKPQSKARHGEAGHGKPGRSRTLSERNVGTFVRSFDLDGWVLRVLERCNGDKTSREILQDPAVASGLGGPTADGKLQRFAQMMDLLAAQEVVFFEP